MVSSFLRDLRRRSLASFRTDKSSSDSSNGPVPTTQSSSTLSSSFGSSTPPSSLPAQHSSPNLLLPDGHINGLTQRPKIPSGQYSRYSVMGSGPPTPNNGPARPTSPFAPRILSVTENAWVHQKVLLIYGQIGDPAQHAVDGVVNVVHHQDAFPSTSWPVYDSHFKALVHLTPGPNRVRFDFIAAKRPSHASSPTLHSTSMNINMLPLENMPPLQLAILMGNDSPGHFDAVPERIQREGNDLDMALRKYKMAAYLWQAFTGEQMYRNRFGRRCFRFEEEWQPGTISAKDKASGHMRNEARIHVIRTQQSTEELRNVATAQELNEIAIKAVRNHFRATPGQVQYVSILMLDTHWDPSFGALSGHVDYGGGDDAIRVSIYGSQTLQSFPSCLEEVVSAFTDCTRTDTRFIANDRGESGSNWEASNVGIGAHLQQIGRLFGCSLQANGIMSGDYVRLNRSFVCREPFSTRTKSPGQRICLPKDECGWHRLDCLRFRYHPCFRIPTDIALNSDGSVQVWSVGGGTVMITATTGIAFIEISTEEEGACQAFIDFSDGSGNASGPLQQVTLTEADLQSRLQDDRKTKRIRLEIFSAGQGRFTVPDFKQLTSKAALMKLPNGQSGFRGGKLGHSESADSRPQQIILESAMKQKSLLTGFKIYHGAAVYGIEFVHEDFTRQLFGNKTMHANETEFNLDTRRGETLMGFYLRVSMGIDGIEILTSSGRRSGLFGVSNSGTGHTLIPPRGYNIGGIFGSCGESIDGFGLIITR